MKEWKLFSVIIILLLGKTILGQSFSNSLFSDHRARSVGDVITVLVVEYASASTEARTTTQKENDHSLITMGGSKTQAYTPYYGLRGDLKNRFDGNASVSRQGRLRTKITATVTDIRPNGDMIIEGSRVVEVNGEKELTTVSGVVRYEDVSWDNTVYSYQLAEGQISYKGKGVVSSGQRPGLIARIFNWIF